jgi:hypothetical protein
MESYRTNVAVELINRPEGFSDAMDIEGGVDISFSIEFEHRDWGIKSVLISVPDQAPTVQVEIWSDEDTYTEARQLKLTNIQVDTSEAAFGQITPKRLEFYKGKWTLIF